MASGARKGSGMKPNPSEATTVQDLIRAQCEVYSPAATYAAIAKSIGYAPSSLIAWVAPKESKAYRCIGAATMADLLKKIGAGPKLIAQANKLWLAERAAELEVKKAEKEGRDV